MDIIKPPRLRKGDLISVVSPASTPGDSSKVHAGVRYFESLGYRVTISQNVFNVDGYLAGTDEERADDLNQAFADKNVKAIICSRGGYGSPRILDLIDYNVVRRNPKILVGYSDITALQLAIFRKTGLITFSGPMMAVEFGNDPDPYTEQMFFDLVTSAAKPGTIRSHKDFRLSFKGKKKVRGRILGGNLSLITSIMGTKYEARFAHNLLLIEEVNEEPYSVDRMLTQLRLAGILKEVSGYLIGQFTDCAPEEPNRPYREIEEIIREDVLSNGKPAVSNIAYGHVPAKLTMPIGIMASIDAVKKKFSIDESAVS